MVSCVFPGSFDPPTKGHLNLISRASAMFDHVTVTVMHNIHKSGTIPVSKRLEMLRTVCREFDNVSIESWDGLLADYMKQKKETIILRGIRGTEELDRELQSAAANRLLNKHMETVLLPSDPGMTGISSTAVREVAAFEGDISPFVPPELTEEISRLLSKQE